MYVGNGNVSKFAQKYVIIPDFVCHVTIKIFSDIRFAVGMRCGQQIELLGILPNNMAYIK